MRRRLNFNFEARARIWPRLSHTRHIRSTATPQARDVVWRCRWVCGRRGPSEKERERADSTRPSRYMPPYSGLYMGSGRKVDVRLPEKGNSSSQGARPVHLIITVMRRIRTSRLSIKNSRRGQIVVAGEGLCYACIYHLIRLYLFYHYLGCEVKRAPCVN